MLSDYIKLIQEWCKLKIALWGRQSKVVFKPGDIWWCSLGMNLGEEIFGKGAKFTRPVLIFRKFTNNSFLGLPLTKQNWVMLNQARVLDKKRLTNRIGALDNSDFKKVREKFLEFYSS